MGPFIGKAGLLLVTHAATARAAPRTRPIRPAATGAASYATRLGILRRSGMVAIIVSTGDIMGGLHSKIGILGHVESVTRRSPLPLKVEVRRVRSEASRPRHVLR